MEILQNIQKQEDCSWIVKGGECKDHYNYRNRNFDENGLMMTKKSGARSDPGKYDIV